MSGVSLDFEDVYPFVPRNLCLGKLYGRTHGLVPFMGFGFSFLCVMVREMGLGIGWWSG